MTVSKAGAVSVSEVACRRQVRASTRTTDGKSDAPPAHTAQQAASVQNVSDGVHLFG